MANSFSELKNSQKANFEKLQSDLAKMASGQKFVKESDDERFWFPSANKQGVGSAVLRFMPAPKGEASPIVRLFSHGFEGPNGWYIEKSLATFTDSQGNPKADPVGIMNRKLWGMGKDSEGQDFVSGDPKNKRPGSKRKLSYYTNVYIVNDPLAPENNGTVRIFKFGARVHDKLVLASEPKYPEFEKFDPFDLFGGANLTLRYSPNEKGFRQFTESSWDYIDGPGGTTKVPRGQLMEDEAKLEQLWLQCHPLFPFVDPAKFKSFNELQERLDRIMGDKFYEVLHKGSPHTQEEATVKAEREADVTGQTEPWEEESAAPEGAVQEAPTSSELQWFHDLNKEVA